MERYYDLIIIDAGAGRHDGGDLWKQSRLSTLILEMGAPGGKLIKTNEISNWPGIKSINGADLANEMFTHATSFGAEYAYGEVTAVKAEDDQNE